MGKKWFWKFIFFVIRVSVGNKIAWIAFGYKKKVRGSGSVVTCNFLNVRFRQNLNSNY